MKILLDNKRNKNRYIRESNHPTQDVDIEKVVDDIINELDSLTTEKVLSILNTSTRNDIDTSSSMFILPNGEILSVADALTTNSIDDMFDDIHDSLGYVLVYNLAKQMNAEESFMDILDDTYIDRKLDSIMSILTYDLGWARINCGTTLKEDRFYCVLPNHMKSTQYHTLQNWLEWGYDTGKQKVLVFVSSYEDGNWYSFSDNFPEDIIKKIKRYYSSGRLYEDVNNKDLLSFIYENLPLQKEMYWWSTFILPDGNFINLDKISEEYDSDEHQVLFDYLSDNGYNVTEADVVEGLGCIKLNIHYPYIGLSDSVRPTPAQCSTLKKWLSSAEGEFGSYSYVKMENHSMTNPIAVFKQYTDKVYDLGVVSPDELVKTIQKSYSSGILEDKRNELKENMNEEFVNELVPGELYHFIYNNKILYGTFKRKTPAWLFFDVEGEEVLAKPWTSVATTTEELEELIGLVNKMEKDTKIPSQVPNRFTRVPNQHNKPMGESNELEQRAKKHRKKSKGMGWHMSMNAGDVEKGIEVFNNSTSLGSSGSGEGVAMGESVEKHLYYYDGPIYYRGNKISTFSNIYTTAKSFEEAARNILFKAAKGDKELWHYDIVDDDIKQMPNGKLDRPKCQQCGYEINDNGDCPVCDYGEDDLLESLSSLEALWELSKLD